MVFSIIPINGSMKDISMYHFLRKCDGEEEKDPYMNKKRLFKV